MLPNFLERTSFHPLWHAGHQTYRTKLGWVLITLLLTLCFVVCLYFVITAYHHNYYETPVQVTDVQSFPKVVVCPNHWIDREKALANDVDDDLLQYILGFMGALSHEADIEPTSEMRYFDLGKLPDLKLSFKNLMENHTSLSHLVANISLNPNSVVSVFGCSSCATSRKIRRFVKSSYTCYEIVYSEAITVPGKLFFSLFPGRQRTDERFAQVQFGNLAVSEHQSNSIILRSDFSYDITLQPYQYRQWHKSRGDPSLTCEQICLLNIQKQHGVRYFMGQATDDPSAHYVHSSDESWLSDHNLKILQSLGTTCTNASCHSPRAYVSYDISTIAYPVADKENTKVVVRLGGGKKVITLSAPDQGNLWANLLSNIGGLLALFLGASISSFIHVFCHFCCGMVKLPRKSRGTPVVTPAITPVENGNASPLAEDGNGEIAPG